MKRELILKTRRQARKEGWSGGSTTQDNGKPGRSDTPALTTLVILRGRKKHNPKKPSSKRGKKRR